MAIYNITPSHNIHLVVSGTVPGDVVNLIVPGVYVSSGNLLRNDVTIHGVVGAILQGTGPLFVGQVDKFIIEGNIIIQSGVINVESNNIQFKAAELNTPAALIGGSLNFNVPSVRDDVQTGGQVTYQAYLQDGIITHDPGAEGLPATFLIQYLSAGYFQVINNKCYLDFHLAGVINTIGVIAFFNDTSGTATIGDCEPGNIVTLDGSSSIALTVDNRPPEIELYDTTSVCKVSGLISTVLMLHSDILIENFRASTVGVCIDASTPVLVGISEGVALTSNANLVGDNVTLEQRSSVTDWGDINGDIENQTDLWSELTSKVVWKNKWIGGTYNLNDMVTDGKWTMIANKQTTDRPSPQPIGSALWFYNGDMGPVSSTGKQIIISTRFTNVPEPSFLLAYRVFTALGFRYEVFMIKDPLGSPIYTEIAQFTGNENGWVETELPLTVIELGSTLDIAVRITDPDPNVPPSSELIANYNYVKPSNIPAPGVGEIVQSDGLMGVLRVNYIDSDANDNTSDLQALGTGDIIIGAGTNWTIQKAEDKGAYIDFDVALATQGAPEGVQQFTFEVESTKAISYGYDANYYSTLPSLEGLYILDGPYEDAIPTQNAYGIDAKLQAATVSADWDAVAFSGAGTGGTGGGTGGGVTVHNELTGRDVDDTHPIDSITNLTNSLNSKEDDLGVPGGNGYFLRANTIGPPYWSGVTIGDMSKSVYDINDDGVVDDSEKLDGQLPIYYDQNAHVANTNNPHSVTAAQTGAEPKNSNIQAHIARTDIHFVINDNATLDPSVAWSSSKIVVELSGKEDSFNKNTAFNQNYGVDPDTVAYGNHLHTGVYEPVFTKNTAFNQNYGTSGTTVAFGNHLHTNVYEPANPNIQAHIANNAIHLSTEERAAMDNSPNSPSGSNPFATQEDLSAGGFGDMLKANYATQDNNIVDAALSVNDSLGKTKTAAEIVDHIDDVASNPHDVTAAQSGADPSGSAAAVQGNLNAHEGDFNNPHNVNKTDVSLGNVDNTSDANKPISDDTQAALDDKEDDLGTPAANGYILASTTGKIRSWVNPSTIGADPAGSTNYIQYNSNGSFAAEAGFEYNASTNRFTASRINPINLSGAIGSSPIVAINPSGDISDSGKTVDDIGVPTDPGGSDEEVQFNDNGVFGGNDQFVFNRVSLRLTAPKLASISPDAGTNTEFVATFDNAGDLNKSGSTIADLLSGTPPAGTGTEIQYNKNGVFGGDINFVYNDSNGLMSVPNIRLVSPDAGADTEFIITTDAAGDLNKSGKTIADLNTSTAPAGGQYQVQYNLNGSFAAAATFTYNQPDGLLRATKFLAISPESGAENEPIASYGTAGDINKQTKSVQDILDLIPEVAGSNFEIQFNNNGALGSNVALRYVYSSGYFQFPIARMTSSISAADTDQIIARDVATGQLNVSDVAVSELNGLANLATRYGVNSATNQTSVSLNGPGLDFLNGEPVKGLRLTAQIRPATSGNVLDDLIVEIYVNYGSNNYKYSQIVTNKSLANRYYQADAFFYSATGLTYTIMTVTCQTVAGVPTSVANIQIIAEAVMT
jgi:hypothetical protein